MGNFSFGGPGSSSQCALGHIAQQLSGADGAADVEAAAGEGFQHGNKDGGRRHASSGAFADDMQVVGGGYRTASVGVEVDASQGRRSA